MVWCGAGYVCEMNSMTLDVVHAYYMFNGPGRREVEGLEVRQELALKGRGDGAHFGRNV